MAITERTRKILWARSGNRCALCRCELVMSSEAAGDRDAVVGDECHIVGQTTDSTRYRDDLSIDSDSYDNLIVLCKTHHKQIDDQPEYFSEENLIALKAAHEQWVRTILEIGANKKQSSTAKGEVTLLPRITSGKELVTMLRNCHALYFDYDPVDTEDDVELIATVHQDIADWLDLLDMVEAGDVVRAGFSLDKQLKELADHGFIVFGERKRQKMKVGGTIDDWQIATIGVLRESNPTIITITTGVDTDS